MAKSQHIEWLLEGVDVWNERREKKDFLPDFNGSNLSFEFYKIGKFTARDLIPLEGINLSNANLSNATLY